MMPANQIAVISDVHGEHRLLASALERCAILDVERIVLLGDLFDRADQIDQCARHLADWHVSGVLGNHEREALGDQMARSHAPGTGQKEIISKLGDRLKIGEAIFVHDAMDWRQKDTNGPAGSIDDEVRIVFAGHTHYRHARDDHGPIDLSLGRIVLRSDRRYVINPGAIVEGQFAIWNRVESTILFERL